VIWSPQPLDAGRSDGVDARHRRFAVEVVEQRGIAMDANFPGNTAPASQIAYALPTGPTSTIVGPDQPAAQPPVGGS
jgi:hypothetical protein